MRQRTALVRWGFAALLIVSAAQVAWWMIDQWWYTDAVGAELRELYEERVAVAESLRQRGLPADEIVRIVPGIEADGTGFAVPDEVFARLAEERRSRLNRYFWEGGFFLAVLLAALSVIAGVLRQDARLRRRQQNFLAAVSHEFKSPLAAARVATETLALRDLDPAARRRHVARLARSIGRLEALVDNLLDSARIESGAMRLRPEALPLPQALNGLLAAMRRRAEESGVTLEESFEPGLEVHADEVALATVMRNLLDNAFNAVADTEDARVRLSARAAAEQVEIEVSDNGVGFDPTRAENLFEKFYRPGDEMRRAGHGAGLGLYIVRALVSESGGSVQARSAGRGQGATFRTRWPTAATP